MYYARLLKLCASEVIKIDVMYTFMQRISLGVLPLKDKKIKYRISTLMKKFPVDEQFFV